MHRLPITIVTNERDFGADNVIRHLALAGGEVRRLNFEGATAHPLPDYLPTCLGRSEPNIVWFRQFDAYDKRPSTREEVDDRLVARAQWRTWMAILDSPGSVWINPLWPSRRAENKIVQLNVASALGLQIPPTIITNDSKKARKFRTELGPCIIKSLSAAYFEMSDQAFSFTTELTDDLLDIRIEGWASNPVLVQKKISADYDGRLILFGDRNFAAKYHREDHLDWRLSSKESWEIWDAPAELINSAQSYMHTMGLRYAAFDFLIENETNWFLEANQAGEWHFLDRRLSLGIAENLARYLMDLAEKESQ